MARIGNDDGAALAPSNGLAHILSVETISGPGLDASHLVAIRYRVAFRSSFVVMSLEQAKELGIYEALHNGHLVPIPRA
jgi:hypothetical protein